MAISDKSLSILRDAVQDGTFVESNDVLTTTLNTQNIPTLLAAITQARDNINQELRDTSKRQAADVDQWIAQAKATQADIIRCKLEARKIVEDHERNEVLRRKKQDTESKISLLENEIVFSGILAQEIETVSQIARILNEIEDDLLQSKTISAVRRISSVQASLERISAKQTHALLERLHSGVRQRAYVQLKDMLASRIRVGKSKDAVWMSISDNSDNAVANAENESLSAVVEALDDLQELSDASSFLLRKMERLLIPLFRVRSEQHLQSATADTGTLVLGLSRNEPQAFVTLGIFEELTRFLHTGLPPKIHDKVAFPLLTKIVPEMVRHTLYTAVPYELQDLQSLEALKTNVNRTAEVLTRISWPGHQALSDWVDQIPRTWLTKRRTTSLDAVRKAFDVAQGHTHEVERIERQPADVSAEDVDDNDWNANWEDDTPVAASSGHIATAAEDNDDDTSGWDFDTEDEGKEISKNSDKILDAEKEMDGDDEGDAWGWGDEAINDEKPAQDVKSVSVNNHAQKQVELVLKEMYMVTDVADYLLNVITKDITDAQTLLSSPAEAYFQSTAPVSALQALPTLTLAMFRATAPSYYSVSSNVSNMNLYNDTLYINERLLEHTDNAIKASLSPTIEVMAKFARQTYTRELDTQRTILSDLLDGAQGFVSCTRFPYSQECTNSVNAVIDRIRQLHTEWHAVLSHSHSLQSIGSLIAMVMGKIIHDVLDMEDISEPESKQLREHFERIAELRDLFVTVPQASTLMKQQQGEVGRSLPSGEDNDESAEMSTIPLYVPNYLRFMYLINILDGSLADIRYMWSEGELRLEFDANEIVDLIKALFAESALRRTAINEIKQR